MLYINARVLDTIFMFVVPELSQTRTSLCLNHIFFCDSSFVGLDRLVWFRGPI